MIEIQHSSYPHVPGFLSGCWACETECLCFDEEGIMACVYCLSLEMDCDD